MYHCVWVLVSRGRDWVDVARIIGEGAAIPAVARTAGIQAEREAEAVILVVGQGAVGVDAALVVDIAAEFGAPRASGRPAPC